MRTVCVPFEYQGRRFYCAYLDGQFCVTPIDGPLGRLVGIPSEDDPDWMLASCLKPALRGSALLAYEQATRKAA